MITRGRPQAVGADTFIVPSGHHGFFVKLSSILSPAKLKRRLLSNPQEAEQIKALTVRVQQLEKAVSEIKKSAALPAPAILKNPVSPSALRIGLFGARSHGLKHLDSYLKLPDCEVAYICDVDSKVAKDAADLVEARTGRRPKVAQDFRRALDDKAIDTVSIVTPHHWHALAAIWSLQAGKHVYLEKPISHTFLEGESVVAAAKKYGKLVQCGTQLRSNASLATAGKYIQDGKLGDIEVVHCICYKPRPAVPPTNAALVPATVDYDLWCGPAALAPVTRSKFHYHWHWFWDFGNGALGNNGIRRIDVARIGTGLQGFGDAVLSYGGRFGGTDSGETPNTQVVVHKFGDTWIVQEIRGLPTSAHKSVSNGIIFYGSKGTVVYNSGAAAICDDTGKVLEKIEGKQQNHYRNFFDAVRKNDPAMLAGNIVQGHISSGLCHLGNISHRLGMPASDADVADAVADLGAPDLVRDVLGQVRAHLDTNNAPGEMMLGQILRLDPATGYIRGNEAASALMRRDDRAPYLVPDSAHV
jgi:predicted dehydrogenase